MPTKPPLTLNQGLELRFSEYGRVAHMYRDYLDSLGEEAREQILLEAYEHGIPLKLYAFRKLADTLSELIVESSEEKDLGFFIQRIMDLGVIAYTFEREWPQDCRGWFPPSAYAREAISDSIKKDMGKLVNLIARVALGNDSTTA